MQIYQACLGLCKICFCYRVRWLCREEGNSHFFSLASLDRPVLPTLRKKKKILTLAVAVVSCKSNSTTVDNRLFFFSHGDEG